MASTHRAADGPAQLFLEFVETEIPAICRAKQPAVRCENLGSECGEFTEIFLHAEDLALFIPRERRRIQHDAIELAALFREAAEPMESVALAEMVRCGIKSIVRKIPLGPVEIRLGRTRRTRRTRRPWRQKQKRHRCRRRC